jgi:hypothetical protein
MEPSVEAADNQEEQSWQVESGQEAMAVNIEASDDQEKQSEQIDSNQAVKELEIGEGDDSRRVLLLDIVRETRPRGQSPHVVASASPQNHPTVCLQMDRAPGHGGELPPRG